jgi:hypothetical protein
MEADTLDQASKLTQEFTDREINRIRSQAAKIDTSNPSGVCLYCGESTGIERRFCDADC